jgi:hypothetical protein
MGYVPEKPPQNFCTGYWIGEGVPFREQSKPPRWTCTYCLGSRIGETCEGCGAPRQQTPTRYRDPGPPPLDPGDMPQPPQGRLRPRIPRPTPDTR